MCNCRGDKLSDKKYRLSDFFDRWWDVYKQDPVEPIRPEQHKAVNSMRVCRTPSLGVDLYACPECGEVGEVYHSCKNRFCPTCSWKDTIKWAEHLKGKMLDLPHRHVVFTLPHALNGLVRYNDKTLLNLLFVSASATLKEWIFAKYGVNPGIISVLHSFGEKRTLHYHVHMIVSWGGIKKSNGALEKIKGEYVNYEFLQKKFRHKFETLLLKSYDSGELRHNYPDRISFMSWLRNLNKRRWVVHLEPSMDFPTSVIRYIGRYSKRACLSEYKITKIEGEYISFRYKDNKHHDQDGRPIERELTLHYREFFPRLLQHVPLPYFRLVRYYGLYSNKGHIPEAYLNKDSSAVVDATEPKECPTFCTYCKKDKLYQYSYIKKKYMPQVFIYESIRLREREKERLSVA